MRKNILFTFLVMTVISLVFLLCGKNPIESKYKVPEVVTVVTDIDGNTYRTVKIGNQWWMAENLRVTRYRNGTEIPKVLDNTSWSNLTTGAYCDHDNNPSTSEIYGRLYNWYAIKDVHNIAPDGWHVPSYEEWGTLVNYLGGQNNAGGKLKETDTTYWKSPNTGADNTSGFSALPGGCRYEDCNFSGIGHSARFWTSSSFDGSKAWFYGLSFQEPSVVGGYQKKMCGLSIRCIKD